MDDIFVMKIRKPIEELANHSPEFMFLIVMDFDFSFFKDLDKKGKYWMKVTFLGILHNDVKILFVHERLIVLDNVGMLKRTQNGDLVVGCFHVVFLAVR